MLHPSGRTLLRYTVPSYTSVTAFGCALEQHASHGKIYRPESKKTPTPKACPFVGTTQIRAMQQRRSMF